MTGIPNEAVRLVGYGAREISDGEVLFVGIGVPSLAALVARRLHAPSSVLVYESGAIDAVPPVPPLSTGSPSVVEDTGMLASCLGVFAMLQQGSFDLGLLSAAQVDRHGNLNSTALGAYEKPKVRLVGSGGAHDIAVLARAAVILMPHDPRRFVPEVDFATSPGSSGSTGDGAIAARGSGPGCVVTPRARFTFEAGELTLDALVDGVDESTALEGFGWSVPRASRLGQLTPLSDSEIAVASDVLESWGRDAV